MSTTINNKSRIRQDLLDAIKYENRQGKHGDAIGKQLGAHFVFKWIFQDTWRRVAASIDTANKCKFHTAESLFNDATAWAEYHKPIRIAIGRCLAYFVENEMLPLFCVNPHASNKQYMVIPDQ